MSQRNIQKIRSSIDTIDKKIITTLNLNYEKNIDKLIINTHEIIKRNGY
jgi:hypothetical protein